MPESIDTFVQKLRDDGVLAGREEGRKVLEEATLEANQILEAARKTANHLIEEGRKTLKQERLQQEQELKLACRDTVHLLRQALCDAVEAVLKQDAASVLDNTDTLLSLITKVAEEFARMQADKPKSVILFRLAKEDAVPLVENALKQISLHSSVAKAPVFQVESGLHEFGFEYRQGGTTVDTSAASVKALLSPYVSKVVAARLNAILPESFQQSQSPKSD